LVNDDGHRGLDLGKSLAALAGIQVKKVADIRLEISQVIFD
jgi:hypothetical protein